ncbi:TonB-dependent receptor family protein [Aquisalimonas asiatica]|uniref:Iron complex outermembrane recepter protein n=1 Tax=Aquisalimonas asiatica TaxID=406100 RepID=A0A1H8TEF3_9GAMM|nr:TonB-dependent receptor [Aquisalimonas asiatica]SEO88974.1 iron complex outermembrane recepter protein [Aquisalimonas asiatica]
MALQQPGPFGAVGVFAVMLSSAAHGEDAVRLDPVTVTGQFPASTLPVADETAAELERIPGGTSLVDLDTVREGRTANLEDALGTTPGVYARSRFGQDETRLSIRGSGLTQTFNNRGVRLLRDGLPVTEADGNTRNQLMDPLTADHMAVYRGANAMGYGAATLGGAINMVSPTGYNSDPLSLRAETGSFGYRRLQAKGATIGERTDAVGTVTGSWQDGFRDNSRQRAIRGYGNVGFQHDDRSQTRLHVEAQDHQLELPGSLTRDQLRNDRRQANPQFEDANAARDLQLGRVTAHHQRQLSDTDQLDLGAFVQDLRMEHPMPFFDLDTTRQDAGVSARHVIESGANRFTWGTLAVTGRERADDRDDDTRDRSTASTVELFADNHYAVTDATTLIGSAQLAWARREVDVTRGDDPDGSRNYRSVSPRIGVLHDLPGDVQLFGNLSRSTEAPVTGELVGNDGELLDQQTADTLELGLRRSGVRWSGEAAVYHARLRDEILLFEDPDNPFDSATRNADRTIHQGVELGLGHRQGLTETLTLETNLTYTYNDFRFDGDSDWGDNRLPGIPRHMARLDVRARHASGAYAGPVVEAASSYPVDFANNEDADSFVIWGLRAGYRSPEGWRVFVDGRNLGDRTYAANTGIVDSADATSTVYNPGAPRSVYGGVEWTW